MPDDNHAVAPVGPRDLATMPIEQALDAYAPNFAAVLPPNIPVDHFKRMVVTAINVNPELVGADRRTLFNSCVKCASDGLLPDGREAALVIYRTKVKDRSGQERWIDAVQYLPMVAGIRKRLRNSGEVDSATAEVVYRKDRFKYRLGDGAFIEHEPPALDEDRGDAIGAYAIIRLSSGETIREVMGIKEIERARAMSRAKDAAAGAWVKWWGEMARKTVLRRAAKAAPQASALEKLLMRDEEADLPEPAAIEPPPPRPRREHFQLPPMEEAAEEESASYAVVDLDGVETLYATTDEASGALADILRDAARRGLAALDGAWESNSMDAWPEDAGLIAALYRELRAPFIETTSPEGTERDLVADGENAAERGVEALRDFWSGLSSQERGTLGARGRGMGPHFEAWLSKAQQADEEAAKRESDHLMPTEDAPPVEQQDALDEWLGTAAET